MVRNPIDVIPSFCLLINLHDHGRTVNEKTNEVDPVWWNTFVTHMANSIRDQTVQMNEMVNSAIPLHYIRYEDLVLRP